MSTSRFTCSPGVRRPRVVSFRVVGMRATVNAASAPSRTSTTVSDTPSTAIDPFSAT
jgi:hypothetical protein